MRKLLPVAFSWRSRPYVAAAVFVLALGVYLGTLAPGITWRHSGSDSGELVAAALIGGVPHPPGYPTYMLLASAFARLPFAEPALGVNLLSALCAAGAAALLALTLMELLPCPSGETFFAAGAQALALIVAMQMAYSPTLWSQAVIAEVYALNALFCAGVLYLARRIWDETDVGRLRRYAWLMAFVWGLGLGNHLSVGLLAPALGLLCLWRLAPRRVGWGAWIGMVAAFVLGLAVYATLPARAAADPPINWGNPRTVQGLWWLVSGQVYRRYLFAFPWAELPTRLASWLTLLRQEFTLVGVGFGLAGVWTLFVEQRRMAWIALLAYAPFVVYAIGYDTADSYVYLIPSYLVFSLWIGYGLWGAWREVARWQAARRWMWAPTALCLILPLLALYLNWPAMSLRADTQAGDYGRAVLARLEPGALLLTDGDAPTFALWYAHYGLGLRPDVAVVNLSLWRYPWYRATLRRWYAGLGDAASLPELIAEQRGRRAIYLNNPESALTADYAWREWGDLLRLEHE
jgi:hypothetical protein